MKKILFYMWFCLCVPFGMFAQQEAEYNKRGDEAMERKDYQDAKIWYEEGVSYCDAYSIDRLTEIWMENAHMRTSMRSLMNKCLNCLNVRGTEQDTTAMRQLITYYELGIGTPVSKDLADYWKDKLMQMRRWAEYTGEMGEQAEENPVPHERMKFFAGYQYAIEAPYGLTIGGIGRRMGWFVRFRTNMAFDKHTAECNGQNGGELTGELADDIYSFTGAKKKKSFAFTGGLVIRCTGWLYTSIGMGYGERTVLYEYNTIDAVTADVRQQGWAKHLDASYKGVAADWDVMLKFGVIYVSAGCNTVNFKYADLSAGLGVFF